MPTNTGYYTHSYYPLRYFPNSYYPGFIPPSGQLWQQHFPDLLEALVALIKSTGVVGGRVWSDEAPDGTQTTTPYIVVVDASEEHEYESTIADPDGVSSDVPHDDTGRIEILIRDTSKANARQIRRTLRSMKVLLDPILSFDDGFLLYLRPSDRVAEKDPQLGVNSVDVWVETIGLKTIVTRVN